MSMYSRAREHKLKDLHIIASDPSRVGGSSDEHIAMVSESGQTHHIFYRVNNDPLVADHVLAPRDWRNLIWVSFTALRETSEAEALHFVRDWRDEGRLSNPPSTVDRRKVNAPRVDECS